MLRSPFFCDILVITQDNDLPDSTVPDLSPEAADLLNDSFGSLPDSDRDPCVIDDIIDHRFDKSLLQLELRWSNGTTTWALFSIVKKDKPGLCAKYILAKDMTHDAHKSLHRWARSTLRTLRRNIR